MTHTFGLVLYYHLNRTKLLIICIVLSYIVIVSGPSIRDIVRPVHSSASTAITPVATLTSATSSSHVIFSNVLFFLFRFLIPGTFGPPADKESVGIELLPSSRSVSRWSRHIGQCYSSVSFLHFFLCILLPLYLSLFLFFSIYHFFLSGTYNTILSAEHKPSTECVNYFLRTYNGRQKTRVGLVSVANSCEITM